MLAIEATTHLTLLFPAEPLAAFRVHFAAALASGLEDLGVSRAHIGSDVAAIGALPLTPLTNRALTKSLKDLEFIAQIELDYTDDLRRAQRRLNDFPHPDPVAHVPAEAVVLLFAATETSSANQTIH